jgi:hypothetical protein
MDYLAVLIAVAIASTRALSRPRDLPQLALGALIPGSFILAYHALCFGSPWTLATSLSNPTYIDPGRALGMFAWPDPSALFHLTLGPYRGVFLQMPLLLLVPLGFRSWWRRTPRDPWLWCCAGSCVAFTLAVAGFNGWHGGSTVCARYLLPCLPLSFLAIAHIRWTPWLTRAASALAALSVFNMLAVAAVNPLCPDEHPNPLYGYTYQALWSGRIAPYAFSIRLLHYDPSWPELRPWAMWNWGELLGLHGGWSLLPLLAAWALGAWLLAGVQLSASRRPQASHCA